MKQDQLTKFLDKYFSTLKLATDRGHETPRETERLDKLELIIRKGKHELEGSKDHAGVL